MHDPLSLFLLSLSLSLSMLGHGNTLTLYLPYTYIPTSYLRLTSLMSVRMFGKVIGRACAWALTTYVSPVEKTSVSPQIRL